MARIVTRTRADKSRDVERKISDIEEATSDIGIPKIDQLPEPDVAAVEQAKPEIAEPAQAQPAQPVAEPEEKADVAAPQAPSAQPEVEKPASMEAVESGYTAPARPSDLVPEISDSEDGRPAPAADDAIGGIDLGDLTITPMSYSEETNSSEEIAEMREAERNERKKRKKMLAERKRGQDEEQAGKSEMDEETVEEDAKLADAESEERPDAIVASEADGAPRMKTAPAEPVRPSDYSRRRFRDAYEAEKERAADDVKKDGYDGLGIYGKIMGDPQLGMREVSIGTREILAAVTAPGSRTLAIINKRCGTELSIDSPTLAEDIMNAVNKAEMHVATAKAPDNRSASYQDRILRIHEGTGIHLHPIMSKQYNADFDGDDMNISFDEKPLNIAKDPMSYLIDIDGKVSLDPDFFPVSKLVGNIADRSDAEKILKSEVFGKRNAADRGKLTRALIEYTEKPSSDTLRDLAAAISEVADKYKSDKYTIMGEILHDIYGTLRKLRIIQAELIANNTESIEDNLAYAVGNKYDAALLRVTDDVVNGNPPANWQDFRVRYCMYAGEAEDNKNISFRCTADIAKMYRFDDRIVLGDGKIGDEDWADIYEKTMAFGMAKRMSGEKTRASRAMYASGILRDIVLTRVGMPDRYRTMKEFFKEFIRVYNINANLINMANVQFTTGMDISDRDNIVTPISGYAIGDVITPFINIYGDFSVGRILSNKIAFGDADPAGKNRHAWSSGDIAYLLKSYEDMSIRKMSKTNRLIVSQKDARIAKEIDTRIDNEAKLVSNMVLAIADARTSAASEFNKKVYSTGNSKYNLSMMEKMLQITGAIKSYANLNEKRSWVPFIEDMTEILYLSGRNIFDHFKMDNPAAFMETRLGKRLVECKTADELGGVRLSMVAEYRLSRFDAEIGKLNALIEEGAVASRIARAENRAMMELDVLSSSSLVWHGIIKEMRSQKGERAFDDLSNPDNRSRVKNLNALKYWSNPPHSSILEVLMDASMGADLKMKVISDVVRWQEMFDSLNAWEVGYQMELDDSSANTDMPLANKSIFDTVRDFDKRFNSFKSRSAKECQRNIDDARDVYEAQGEYLLNTLRYLADNPNALIEIRDETYADALISAIDKEYAQSEKSGQNPRANLIYWALTTQNAGSQFSDVKRTDDDVIGVKCVEDVSIIDIVKILAYPEKSIVIYDSSGSKPKPVSRDILCGKKDADESDIWDFLHSHPRIASAIRMHQVNSYGTDGKGYLSAKLSTAETIYEVNERSANRDSGIVKSMLRDQPIFGGLVAAITPTAGIPSRNMREKYIAAERYVASIICDMAHDKAQSSDDVSITETVDDVFGLSMENIDATGIFHHDGYTLRNQIIGYLDKVTNDLAEMEIKGDVDLDRAYVDLENHAFDPRFDRQSLQNYFDVKQELNGAKTNISTGIEGTETFKMALWMSLLSPTDKYDIVGSYTEDEVLDQLDGQMTSLGVPLSKDNIKKLEEQAGDDGLMVEVPEGFVVKDKTTDNYGRQISSVNCYLMIKRDNGAEEFNLKVKKYGVDDLNSIMKHRRDEDPGYTNAKLNGELRDVLKDTKSIFQVKIELAKRLEAANRKIGYKDMDLANYMCLADLMVVPVTDPQTGDVSDIALRSLEQISYTIKHNLSKSAIDSADPNVLREEAERIAGTVGIEDTGFDVVDAIEGRFKVHGNSDFSSVHNKSASSWSRNYDLLKQITRDFMASKGKVVGKKTIAKKSKAIVNKLENMMGLDGWTVSTIIDFVDHKTLREFDILGIMGTDDVTENPGPQTMWVFAKFDGFDAKKAERQFDRCYELGMTVLISPEMVEYVPSKYRSNIIQSPVNESMYMIPFFDVRLNGAEAAPNTGNMWIGEGDEDAEVFSYEDIINEFSLGDSDTQPFSALTDRMSIVDNGNETISVESLFPNVFKTYSVDKAENYGVTLNFSFADDPTIKRFFVNESPQEVMIDYGVTETSYDFHDRVEYVNRLIGRYREQYAGTGHNGWVENATAGDIVGWMECQINDPKVGYPQYCYAPIIPFDVKSGFDAPSKYRVNNIKPGTTYTVDGMGLEVGRLSDVTSVSVNWTNTTPIDDAYFKIHDGAGAANKGMMYMNRSVQSLNLKNGIPLDYCYARESTESRRGGTNKRIQTMVTMMMMARRMGYNFAKSEGAFPDRPDISKELQNGRISREKWKEYKNSGEIRFHSDPKIDAWVRMNVNEFYRNGGNPSDFLANEFPDGRTRIKWEYQCLFEQGYAYQNGMMRFFNSMMPDFCPPGLDWFDITDNADNYLFLPSQSSGFDWGCMQMLVPHRSAEDGGKVFYLRENVYGGYAFFSDFSGFHKPNINGASIYMDALNTMSLHGFTPANFMFEQQLRWATSDMGEIVDNPGNILLDRSNKNKPTEEDR